MPPGADPATKSRFEMLLSPKEHEMHHRGQLMTMQRMIGLVPHLTRQIAGADGRAGRRRSAGGRGDAAGRGGDDRRAAGGRRAGGRASAATADRSRVRRRQRRPPALRADRHGPAHGLPARLSGILVRVETPARRVRPRPHRRRARHARLQPVVEAGRRSSAYQMPTARRGRARARGRAS